MNWRVPLSDIDFDEAESLAVEKVLKSRWLTMGKVTQEFEAAFAAHVQSKHAIAVTNATAALHLACLALGLGPGDEVIVPSLTFVATANAVRYVGATPVFADIVGDDNLNISPESISALITPQTRAIIVVHYAGYPCDMEAILSIAKQHGLFVIEDAAHAVGSELNGRKLGVWGDIGCFSFFSNKNMTTGEGGMMTTDNDELAQKLNRLRSHGMTSLTWDRHKGHAYSYDVIDLGYNYRIDEIRAAIGLAQLSKVERNNERRRLLTQVYRDALQELAPQVNVPFQHHLGKTSAHIMPVLLPSETKRQEFIQGMKENGIQTSIHYPPIHTFTSYKDDAVWNLPVTEDIAKREITLPLYPAMSNDDVIVVVSAIRASLNLS
ncbi:MAG TPA: DegT/DnrJ/EryC1/StrS family aminotransferase [Anaerolineales bacterium]|nr:DegT/DnrJ/EryC1/StrS family aminotransferase [Anaerolineales bacterium]